MACNILGHEHRQNWCESISNGAQYVTLQNIFLHPSYSLYAVCNPTTHTTETWTANRVGDC
jgi:hypothetical protein